MGRGPSPLRRVSTFPFEPPLCGFPIERCTEELLDKLGCLGEQIDAKAALVPAAKPYDTCVEVPAVPGLATAASALFDRRTGTVFAIVLNGDTFCTIPWPHPVDAEQSAQLSEEALISLCTLSTAYIGFLLALAELDAGKTAWAVHYGAEKFVEYRSYSKTAEFVADFLLENERSGTGERRPWFSRNNFEALVKDETRRKQLKEVLHLFDGFDLGLQLWLVEVEEEDFERCHTDIYVLYKRAKREHLSFSELAKY